MTVVNIYCLDGVGEQRYPSLYYPQVRQDSMQLRRWQLQMWLVVEGATLQGRPTQTTERDGAFVLFPPSSSITYTTNLMCLILSDPFGPFCIHDTDQLCISICTVSQ